MNLTAEIGRKISESHKKSEKVLEQCRKMSENNRGKKRSEETKLRISESNKGKVITEETRKLLSEAKKGSKLSEETKLRISERTKESFTEEVRIKMSNSHKGKSSGMSGKKLSEDQRKTYSLSKIGKPSGMLGKKHSLETKKKLRLQTLTRIENNYGILPQPFYNIEACYYFYLFDSYYNTKGRYAVYGNGEFQIKELGYFVDYINFDLKLIMEWDENKHYDRNGRLKEKDVIRQQEIQNLYPDFEFRRLKSF